MEFQRSNLNYVFGAGLSRRTRYLSPLMATALQMRWAGAALLAAGLMIAVLVRLHPEGLNAPSWVVYLGAAIFAFGGGAALARAYAMPSVTDGLVCLLLACMLAIAAWISIAPGARLCVSGAFASRTVVPELACRSVFGAGALILGAMLVLSVRGWLRRRSRG